MREGRTNTRPFMLDNLIEVLPIVNPNNVANHFKYYDHVVEVNSNLLWVLTR